VHVSFCRASVEASKKALKQAYHCPETNSLQANDYLGAGGEGEGQGLKRVWQLWAGGSEK
jgi:hypothetical protein